MIKSIRDVKHLCEAAVVAVSAEAELVTFLSDCVLAQHPQLANLRDKVSREIYTGKI